MIIIIYYSINKNYKILIKSYYYFTSFFVWTLDFIEHNTGNRIGYIFKIRICLL